VYRRYTWDVTGVADLAQADELLAAEAAAEECPDDGRVAAALLAFCGSLDEEPHLRVC
jgi:hypothetical protein